MKDNLEKAFKTLLENHEEPTPNGAWDNFESFRSKNSASSQSSPSSSNTLKYIVGSGVIAASIGLFVLFQTDNTANSVEISENKSSISTKTNDLSSEKVLEGEQKEFSKKNNAEKSIENNAILSENDLTNSEEYSNNESAGEESNNAVNQNTEFENYSESNQTTEEEQVQETKESTSNFGSLKENLTDNSSNDKRYGIGSLSSLEICAGEAIIISNETESQKVKFKVGQRIIELGKNQSMQIIPTGNSTVSFLNENNEIISSEEISVHSLPSPTISHTSNIFENGLPVTNLETTGSYKKVEWYFEDRLVSKENTAQMNFFEKRNYLVELEVADFNGCSNRIAQKIDIVKEYNLLAVDAFRPNNPDVRLRTFIPFALTQREANFEMFIIDPRDNSVVFQTKDSNNPWDGRDGRNGKMTPANTVYVWKVRLKNPLPGENAQYVGTVIHD